MTTIGTTGKKITTVPKHDVCKQPNTAKKSCEFNTRPCLAFRDIAYCNKQN